MAYKKVFSAVRTEQPKLDEWRSKFEQKLDDPLQMVLPL